MTLEPAGTPDTFRVRVDANEVCTDSGKHVPYPTWIGTVKRGGAINVWYPAGYRPRDYRATAERMLREAVALIPPL